MGHDIAGVEMPPLLFLVESHVQHTGILRFKKGREMKKRKKIRWEEGFEEGERESIKYCRDDMEKGTSMKLRVAMSVRDRDEWGQRQTVCGIACRVM